MYRTRGWVNVYLVASVSSTAFRNRIVRLVGNISPRGAEVFVWFPEERKRLPLCAVVAP